jgi:hypothetical protein
MEFNLNLFDLLVMLTRWNNDEEDVEKGVCGDGKPIKCLGNGVYDGPISFFDVQQLPWANDVRV